MKPAGIFYVVFRGVLPVCHCSVSSGLLLRAGDNVCALGKGEISQVQLEYSSWDWGLALVFTLWHQDCCKKEMMASLNMLLLWLLCFFYLMSNRMSSMQKEKLLRACTPHPPYPAKDIFKT